MRTRFFAIYPVEYLIKVSLHMQRHLNQIPTFTVAMLEGDKKINVPFSTGLDQKTVQFKYLT